MAVDVAKIRRAVRNPAMFRELLWVPSPHGPRPLGTIAADFQKRDFAAMDLLVTAIRDGRIPSPRFLWLERTKGSAKTSDVAVMLIWLALVSPRLLLIQVAASDEEQAAEVSKVVRSIFAIPQNKLIAERLRVAKSGQIENPETGTTVEILTADAMGSHGARPDLLILDEISHAKNWPFVETCLDNSMKMPAGGVIVCTNAGLLTSESYKLRETARQSPLWHFSAFMQPAPWLNAAEIAERRRTSTASRFKRLWGGIWTTEADDGINPDLIQQAITLHGGHFEPLPDHHYFVGVDSAVRKDTFAVVTLGVSPFEKRIKLAEIRAWSPQRNREINLAGCEEYIRDLLRRDNPDACWADPSHFWSNVQNMRSDGFNIEAKPVGSGMLEDFASALLSCFNTPGMLALYDSPLTADLMQLEIQDCGARFKVKAERTARGHADRGFAFCMALVPAVQFLKFGGFEVPSSARRPTDPATTMAVGHGRPVEHGPATTPYQQANGMRWGIPQPFDRWNRVPLGLAANKMLAPFLRR